MYAYAAEAGPARPTHGGMAGVQRITRPSGTGYPQLELVV
jgi:hypothetical protein